MNPFIAISGLPSLQQLQIDSSTRLLFSEDAINESPKYSAAFSA